MPEDAPVTSAWRFDSIEAASAVFSFIWAMIPPSLLRRAERGGRTPLRILPEEAPPRILVHRRCLRPAKERVRYARWVLRDQRHNAQSPGIGIWALLHEQLS